MADIKTIYAPLSEDFVLMSNNRAVPFVFADSTLLEALEALMEDPVENLKAFTEMHKAVSDLVGSGLASRQMLLLYQMLLSLLIELREFDLRCQEYVVMPQE